MPGAKLDAGWLAEPGWLMARLLRLRKAALAAQGQLALCARCFGCRAVGPDHLMLHPPTLFAGGTVREYFDLDAPQNNRAVLDYGDL